MKTTRKIILSVLCVICGFIAGNLCNNAQVISLKREATELKDSLSFEHELLYNYEMASYGWDTDSVIDSLWTTKYNELKAANAYKRRLIKAYENYLDVPSRKNLEIIDSIYKEEL